MTSAATSATGMERRRALARARLYLVLEAVPARRALEAIVAPALRGGVDVVQLREKHAGDDAVLAAGRSLRGLCDSFGALLLVNDRPDLARACGADGVHVGQDDTPVAEAREVVGPDLLIGLSTHSGAQLEAAGRSEVDYVGVGPVYATPTKAGRLPVGLDLVRHAARHATLPFFAIGGIDSTNVAEVVTAGAARIAVVRAIRDAADPEAAARALAEELHEA